MKALAWTKGLPENWEVKPLLAVARYSISNVDKKSRTNEIPVRLCNYADVYHREFIALDHDFMPATASKAEIKRFRLRVGDVLITKDSESWDDIGVPALVRQTSDDLVCGYHLALLRSLQDRMAGDFLFRCLQAKPVRVQLELAANGVTRFGIPKSSIGRLKLPVPPLSTQRAIADYLGRETARLDSLVAEGKRVLALLAEKRQAIISRAVTRGLDPGVSLCETGIPWLKRIPAHWQMIRTRFVVASIEQGWSPVAEKRRPRLDEWGVLKLNAVSKGSFDETAVKALPLGVEPRTNLEVRRGDVLVTRSNTRPLVGDACVIEATPPRLMLSDIIYRLILRSGALHEKFFVYFLTVPVGRVQIETDASGTSASMVKISQEHIKDWLVPIPPLAEQGVIVTELARKTQTLDNARSEVEKSISLLAERRSVLISAAVTGQIDIGDGS